MATIKQTDKPKRIVSWPAYVLHLGIKSGASAFAGILYTIGGIGIALGIACLVGCMLTGKAEGIMLGLLGGAMIGGLSGGLIYYGRKAHGEVRAIPRVEPLTKKNIVELPAQDTLVRGSSEPVSPQKDTLLRPAQGSSAAAEQELLLPR